MRLIDRGRLRNDPVVTKAREGLLHLPLFFAEFEIHGPLSPVIDAQKIFPIRAQAKVISGCWRKS